jgi:hypothetical protein
MLDNRDEFLNRELFTDFFIMCCTTVYVTGTQNDYLSINGTDNRYEDLKILVPTDQQYVRSKINLFYLSNDRSWNDKSIAPADNVIITPKLLLEYEQQYI